MANWMDRAKDVTPKQEEKQPSWMSRAKDVTPEVVEPEVTNTQALAMGGIQGVTLNTADEIQAGYRALKDKFHGDPASLSESYESNKDRIRAEYKRVQDANPEAFLAGNVLGGTVASLTPGLNIAKGASLATTAGKMALQGGLAGYGGSEAKTVSGQLVDTAVGAGVGAVLPVAFKGVGMGAEKASKFFGKKAEKLYEAATGANASQAAKFEEGAGRQLRNKRLVGFGDSAEDIAKKTQAYSERQAKHIEDILVSLDKQGIKANMDNVVKELESKITDLSKSRGNEKIIKQIKSAIKDIYEAGASEVPISVSEASKKNYQNATNYFSPELEKKASSHIARAFMKESERAATAGNKTAAFLFKQAKKNYKLIAPIEEAATKAGFRQNMGSPVSLSDLVAMGVGAGTGGVEGGMASYAGKKLLLPRATSAYAVSIDKVSQLLATKPESLGPYGPMLRDAAKKGIGALMSTHAMLQETQPGYRSILEE